MIRIRAIARPTALPRPAVAAASAATSALAAVGAAFIAGAIAILVLEPYWQTLGDRAPVNVFEAAGFVGGIAGGATALAAGGRAGIVAYALWSVAIAALPGCWGAPLGIPIGLVVARAIRTTPHGANPTLEGAGAYSVVGSLFLPLGLLTNAGIASLPVASIAGLLITAAQALVASYVIARRSPRQAWSAAVIALVVLARPAPLTVSQLQVAFEGGFDRAPVFLFPLAAAALLFAGTFGFRRALSGVAPIAEAE